MDSDGQKKEEETAKMPSADSGNIVEKGVVNPENEEPELKIQDDGTDKNKNTKDTDITGTHTKEDSEKYVKKGR